MRVYTKDQALVEMINGAIMQLANPAHGGRYFIYSQGLFLVSETIDFIDHREWNPNYGSTVVDWIKIEKE